MIRISSLDTLQTPFCAPAAWPAMQSFREIPTNWATRFGTTLRVTLRAQGPHSRPLKIRSADFEEELMMAAIADGSSENYRAQKRVDEKSYGTVGGQAGHFG